MKKEVYQKFVQDLNTERQCKLYSFEGIEGSGKSTQIKLLKKNLEERGHEVYLFREPGQTPLGENIRSLLLDKQLERSELSNVLLFLTSRSELINQKIIPLLNNDKAVILIDRYFDSTVAYQVFAGNFSFENLCQIHSCDPLNLLPDQTFYLKISYELSLQRQNIRNQEKDYFESKPKSFYESLIEGFDFMAKVAPNRVNMINADSSLDDIHKEILSLCNL